MKKYGVNELRKMFLDYFESKGHLVMKSFSLVPHNDNSLLLINAGMAPLKPYFTGQEIPPRRRVATCQKCIRTGDIENVGKTARHGTFFEMLGNFSFGDYFKREAIHWSWEFLTEVVGLDPDRLYPSVYLEDDEAFAIWRDEIGIAPERIYKFGKEDNFWEHGAGPCGPCSEIYYDRGEKYGCGKPTCTIGCDCDRYMEVWNNVFTQFENDGHNNYTQLEQKNIDTGMGLERLAVVVQDVDSIFDVDTIRSLRDKVCEMAHKTYKEKEEDDISIRLITDHIRSATFMISDGIMPSNEGRGYVLRRIIRRAARHGKILGIEGQFLAELSKTVIEGSKDGYPELEEKKDFIFNVLTQEESKFSKTIDQGLSLDDGVIPEAVFQNIRRTQESFVYRGKLADGTDYTLTYQGAEIQAAADIQAGVKISQGDVSVEGAALQVEFLQNGSMNGPVTLETTCSAADGTYDLYWLNPDKLTIQSAGTAQVASGKLKMTVSIGGRYWLAKEILGLNGNDNSGTPEGLTSNAQGELTILGNSDTEKSLAGTGSGYSFSTSRSASTGSARKVSTSSAASSSQNILKVETEGIMSKEELEEIKGTSRNLQGEGKLNDKISYTLTINGEDVERTEDFQFRIRTGEDCEHKEDIETLAQEPLILCMESMETFPGRCWLP